MSQQVRVERDLVFAGYASSTPNVKGRFMPELNIFDDHFVVDCDENDWVETTNGVTVAHGVALGGVTTLTTGATSLDCGELSHDAAWSASKNCGMEVKLKTDKITDVCICCGFVDQIETTNDHVAGEISGTALRDCSNTDDFALFVFDTDQDTDVWYVGASEGGAEGTPAAADGSLAPVAGTYARLRVQTDTSGNVTFYYNGVAVGYLPTAIAYAAANLLTPYVGYISRTEAAHVLTVDRITTWQDD